MNTSNNRFFRLWFVLISLLCTLLFGTTVVSAQGTPTPISIGENQFGSITSANGNAQYRLAVDIPQRVEIQVLGIASGFTPTFVVLDPNGDIVLDVANPGSQTIVQGTPALFHPGEYIIEISGVNGIAGQFVISVQPGEPLALQLTLGENQIGSISETSSTVQYELTVAAPQSINLQVLAITTGLVPAFRVLGADDSVLLDVANANEQNIARGIVNLPAAFTYIVEVRSANNTPGQYLISAQPNVPLPTATRIASAVPTSTVTLEAHGMCGVTPHSSQAVNVRFGPGTSYNIVGSLAEGANAPVIGRLANNSWFQIDRGNGLVGWVSAGVVTLSGNCTGVGVVVPPPLPTQPASTTSAPSITPTAISSTQAPSVTPTTVSDEVAPTATTPPVATAAPPTLPIFEAAEMRPDLIIAGTAFRFDARNGGPVSFTYSIANQGRSNAGPFTLRLCVSTTCFDQVYSGIWAGGGTGGSFNIGQWPTGTTASYVFAIDFANDVNEADETNNLKNGIVHF